MRGWFWEIQQQGQGPDWWFRVVFELPASAVLAAMPIPGFARVSLLQGQPLWPCGCQPEMVLVDAHAAERLAEPESGNIWIYHEIRWCQHTLEIERGYGGSNSAADEPETTLLVALATTANLPWRSWEAGYGGQGYSGGTAASGTTAAEFLAYVDANR